MKITFADIAGLCIILSPILWPLFSLDWRWFIGANVLWLVTLAVLRLERKDD